MAELHTRGGNIDLVQVLSQMMMIIQASTLMTTLLLLRLNGHGDAHRDLLRQGELDKENIK